MLFVHSYPAVLIIGLKNNQQNCLYRALTPSASISQLLNKIEMGEFHQIHYHLDDMSSSPAFSRGRAGNSPT